MGEVRGEIIQKGRGIKSEGEIIQGGGGVETVCGGNSSRGKRSEEGQSKWDKSAGRGLGRGYSYKAVASEHFIFIP